MGYLIFNPEKEASEASPTQWRRNFGSLNAKADLEI